MSLAPGVRLGPYEIVALLGAGGMGEVYKAIDTRLGRTVAIKVLRGEYSDRFQREARAIAALNHRHICALYDIGPNYLVMEYLEGAPVRGPLPVEQALRLALEIAAALEEAHRKGIIHRDLKPGNILISSDGAKLLDFGLAKLEHTSESDVTETQAGTVLGTAAYMSPEQAEGRSADARSDIFSFGAVLYEVLSGQRAFLGETGIAAMASILREQPKPLRDAPAELERIVTRCLRKDPARRFQSMAEVRIALADALSAAAKKDETPSIAVLPFANLSADKENEYFSDGITESILNSLAHIAQLRVTSRSVVFRYKGKDMDPQAIGRELNVRVVLTGRVIQRGEALVVSTELTDVAEGSQLWGERYNRKLSDIFALEEEIARKISESLRMKLTGEEKQRLAKRFTENSEAYQLYLKGRHHWTKRTPDSMQKGFGYFQQAIEKDPGYALAYAGLADCHSMLSIYGAVQPREGWAKAKAAAAAAALDPDLAEGHTSLAFIKTFADWDWAGAEKEFQRALELNPSYWVAPYWYAMHLAMCGRYDEAERQAARAQELEPLLPMATWVGGCVSFAARRFSDAIDRCSKAIELDPHYPLGRLWLGIAYQQDSRHEEAIREIERAAELLGFLPFALGFQGHAYAVMGNHTEAQRVLHEMLELAGRRHVDAFCVALVYAGLGEQDHAFEWLENACNNHSSWLTQMAKNNPTLDGLRPDPRFQNILRRMGLDQ